MYRGKPDPDLKEFKNGCVIVKLGGLNEMLNSGLDQELSGKRNVFTSCVGLKKS